MEKFKIYLRVIVFWSLSSFVATSYAQFQHPEVPFEQIEFLELKPIWSFVSYDQSIVGDSCDGYNFFSILPLNGYNQLIEGNHLYRIQYRKGRSQPNGTYIEKVDMESGQSVWRDYYGVGQTGNAEFGRLLFFDVNNNLVVISQIFPEDPVKDDFRLAFGYKKMKLTKRLYNKYTGELISYTRPDLVDTTYLNTSYTPFGQTDHFYQLGKNPDSLVYIYYEASENPLKPLLKARKISVLSKAEENVPVTLEYKYDKVFSFPKPFRISDSLYLTIEVIEIENKVIFRFFNQDFVFVKESVSERLDVERVTFLNLDDVDIISERILISYEPKNLIGIDNPSNQFLVFDWDGNLISKIKLPFAINNKYPVMSWKQGELIVANNQVISDQGILGTLDLLKWQDDTLMIQKSFQIIDSFRYISYFQVLWENNEKVLINARQSAFLKNSFFNEQDIHASAQVLLMLNKNDLDLVSKVFDTNYQKTKIKLYPNPATDFIKIEFVDREVCKIKVFNSLGIQVIDYTVESESTEIKIMNLPVGPYFVTYTDGNGILSGKPLKFIKN